VTVVYCSSDFYHKIKVFAAARMALKQQGIAGLNQSPCLRALLTNLPVLLQEQHTYEKVNWYALGASKKIPHFLFFFGITSAKAG